MSDLLEEAKAYIGFPRLGTRSVPTVNIIEKLIAEVERLRDVHKHYLFELDRANKLTKELDELLEKYNYEPKTTAWQKVKKLEAENADLKKDPDLRLVKAKDIIYELKESLRVSEKALLDAKNHVDDWIKHQQVCTDYNMIVDEEK